MNRRDRNKEQLKKKTEALKMKVLSKEIDSLPDIMQKIAKEDEEKQKRRICRLVSQQERLKTHPPRFGKHKFVSAPTQVLLSDGISAPLVSAKA
ncbi:hypothetical protein AgCh_006463 [Apium graveolens]